MISVVWIATDENTFRKKNISIEANEGIDRQLFGRSVQFIVSEYLQFWTLYERWVRSLDGTRAKIADYFADMIRSWPYFWSITQAMEQW